MTSSKAGRSATAKQVGRTEAAIESDLAPGQVSASSSAGDSGIQPDAGEPTLVRLPVAPAVLELFANTGDGVVVVDADLTVVMANAAAQRFLGSQGGRSVGRPCYDVFDCGVVTSDQCWLYACAQDGRPISQHELPVKTADGTRQRVTISTIAAEVLPGSLPYLVHVFRPAVGQPPEQAPRPELRVFTLGGFRVEVAGPTRPPARSWGRKKVRDLFKYLVTHRERWVTRDELLDALWPDLEVGAAGHNLRQTLSALRRVIEPDLAAGMPSRYVLAKDGSLRLAGREVVEVDAANFERSIAPLLGRECQLAADELETLETAMALYQGDFLPEDLYEDWTLEERQRLLDLSLAARRRLAQEHDRAGRLDLAVVRWQELVHAMPADEGARVALMRALVRAGRRPEAVQHYQAFARFLDDELGVQPLRATTELYQQIIRGVDR